MISFLSSGSLLTSSSLIWPTGSVLMCAVWNAGGAAGLSRLFQNSAAHCFPQRAYLLRLQLCANLSVLVRLAVYVDVQITGFEGFVLGVD